VDILTYVPQQFGELILREQKTGGRTDVHYGDVFGTYYFQFNCQQKPFDDKRVRKALALAIDKQKIVDDVTRMNQSPCNLYVAPKAIPNYKSPEGLGMDLPAAKKLLADAGYADPKSFPVAEILYNKEAIHEKVAQAIGQMWQKNLGINVSFRGVERGAFRNERRNHNFAIARGGWYGDYMDPTTWLDLAKTGDGNNDGLFSNKDYDALLVKAAKEPDAAKRFAILREAERILVEDEFPFIPLYQYADGYMFDDKKIGGLDMNVRLLTQFKYVYKK
jgi:oligopeptide transport system substrate-binding protein